MKKKLLTLALLHLFFAACTTTTPIASLEDSYLMRVECRDDVGVRQSVLSILRQARPRDINEDKSTGVLVIEAAFYKTDNPVAILQKMEDELRRMPEVTYLQIQDNHSV